LDRYWKEALAVFGAMSEIQLMNPRGTVLNLCSEKAALAIGGHFDQILPVLEIFDPSVSEL
jgi:hypothetical protein